MAENLFRRFWGLGYRKLVPIIPPGVTLSPHSSLAKRPGALGKSPGIQGGDGLWRGFDWLKHETIEQDLDAWHEMGAGVGIVLGPQGDGTALFAVDIDALDQAVAERVERDTIALFGAAPMRIGRAPKRLLLYRGPDDTRVCRITFAGAAGDERVELLAMGQQFVAHGVHPVSKGPYVWPRELVPRHELTFVPANRIADLWPRLKAYLPSAVVKDAGTTSERAAVDQDALKGDIDKVRRAVDVIPNTREHFGEYIDFVRMGVAIRAATANDPAAGFEIFDGWFSGWPGDGYSHEAAEAYWRSFKPPYAIGAGWLYSKAQELSDGRFTIAHVHFEPVVEPGALFPLERGESATVEKVQPLDWIDPTTWEGQPVPKREWEVEGWIPRREVTLLYGDGGVGKSLLAHQYATCAATGRDWLGQKTRPARVMGFFCEDSADELHRRQIDINACLGVSFSDLASLRLVSRKHMDNYLALWQRNTGEMKRQLVWEQLRDDAKRFRADVLIIDTLADTYSGSEIDRGQVNAFVKSCLGRLAQEIGGSLILLGHPSQSGKSSGDGTSGSTAWSNAARSRLYLRYPTKDARRATNIRELEGMKLNYGPKGALLKLRWHRGAFECLAGSVPGAEAASLPQIASLENALESAIVRALLAHPRERLATARNSQYYAPTVLKLLAADLLDAFSKEEVADGLAQLQRKGTIRPDKVGKDASGRGIPGFVVVQDPAGLTYSSPDDGIFG